MTMKLAFVGSGGISKSHLRGLAALNEHAGERLYELAAIADPRGNAAEGLAAEAEQLLGRRPAVYEDYRTMLDNESLDAAALLVPHNVHWEIARDCLEAGLHLQVQKPIAITIADGHRIIDLAKDRQRSIVVSEPAILGRRQRALIAAFQSGAMVGPPRMLLDYAVTVLDGGFFGHTPWRHLKGMAGAGWFVDHGVHRTHWFLEAVGSIDRVWASAKTFEPVRSDEQHGSFEVDTEDCAMAGLEFANGARGHFLVASAGSGQRFDEVRIYGDQGVADLTRGQLHRAGSSTALDDATDPFLDEAVPTDPMAHSFLELHRLAVDGEAPICTGERALEALAVVYACLEANTIGAPVRVADVLSGAAHSYEDTIDAARAAWHDYDAAEVS